MRRALILYILSVLACAGASRAGSKSDLEAGLNPAKIVREMNIARQHPAVYASYLEELRGCFHGNIFILPGGTMLRTREGVSALDEAVRFLRQARPILPLTCSRGISMATAEHVADQASGAFGHRGSDRSSPGERMNRYGTWSALWAENISYGKTSARDIIIALIIDDGLRARKHRHNIFNAGFNYAGAAIGSHARYRTMCSIDFAGGYVEGPAMSRSLWARN